MTRRPVAALTTALLAAGVAGLACRDANRLIDVASLTVTPASTSIIVDGTARLTAVAFDRAGVPFIGAPATWTSSDNAIVSVSSKGIVTGEALGTATITATSGELTATAVVTVTPAPVIQLTQSSVNFAAIGNGPDPAPDSVVVTNSGGGTLSGLALDTVRYGPGAADWLVASLNQGTAPATLSLTATSYGLPLGTYTATVVLTAPLATNSPDSVVVQLVVGAGAATQIAANAGDGQSATVGTAVATAPSVIVRDQYSNPVAGVAVTFAVASGGGNVTGANATSGPDGIASVGSWTMGTGAGANALTATSGSLAGSPVTFNATGTAGAATQASASQGDGQSATAGGPVATAPAVLVADQYGNPVAGVSVTFAVASGGGNVTGAAQPTDAAGIATVGSWTLGTTAGPNSLTGTANGVATPVTFTATGTPGAAAVIAATAGDGQSVAVNSAVATPPTVRVTDQFGNGVAGAGVAFAVASGGGNVTGASPTTDATGFASVGSWTLGTSAGSNTLSATAPGLSGSPVTFSATATAGAATQMAVNAGNSQSATVNTAVATPPSVLVRDQFNNPVPGVSVTFAVTGGGGSLTGGAATTNASGIAAVGSWTLGTSAGPNSLSATSSGLAGSPVAFSAAGTADAATQIAVSAGAGQTATVNSAVATAPAVVVRDQFSNPVAGVSVTFAVTGGGGSLTGGAATTNGSGVATLGSWTLGTVAGTNNNTLTATSSGLTGSPVTFTASATAGAATQIALNAGDAQTATVGTAVPIAPSVVVRDQFNNPKSGVGVTFAVTGGGGSVAGGNATTNASGIAQVTSWTLGSSTGANTLTATAGGLAGSPVTFTATAFAGSAAIIALSGGNAQTDTAGASLTVAYTVLVTDNLGNPVQGVPVGWAVTGGGGSILPATSNTNAGGIASASRTLGTTAGTNSATASVGGLAGSPVTFTATATAATATQIALNAGNGQSATVNTAVAVDPSVIVRDQFNNPKAGVGVAFAASGNGSVTGGGATTNASGIATVGSWTLDTLAGANTLTATAAGLTGSPVNFSATGTAGAATQIALSAGNNQSAIVNTNVATAPAVLVRDQYNNPKSGVSVTFAVQAGGGSVTGGAAATNASGIATVGSWKVGTAAGSNNNTLNATSAGLVGSPVAFTASATHDVATQIAVNAGDNQSAAVSTTVPIAPSVLVSDQFGNPVNGISVTFAVTAGSGSVNPTTAITTNASGIAQVTSWTLGSVAGPNSLSATSSPALTGSPVTINATAFAGTATQMALNAGDGQTDSVGATLSIPYSVVVRDASNNPVQGVPVSWALGSGGGSILPGSSNTDVNGIASATRTLGTTAGAQTATASVGGLTGSPVTFTATATAGSATQIAVNAGDGQSATVNTTVATAPSVIVRDQFSNPKAGVSVSFAVGLGGGSRTGGAQTTDAAGVATVGSWTLGTAAGTNTLTATSAGLTGSPVTFTAAGTADAATQIALNAGNNQSATVNTAVATAPSVLVRDQFSNPVASVSVTFAVGLGGGGVTGGNATTDASGIATVGSWTLGTTAGTNNNTLTATSGSLSGSPVTFTASAAAAGAAQLALNTGDGQTATVNTAVATDPSVAVTDQFGNPVAGVVVSFAVQNGGGGVTGAIDTTDASGIATVGAWTLGTIAGTNNNTLTASSGSLSGSPVTFTASATAGAATQIALNAGDGQTATVNSAVATAPSVVVRDAFNNPVSSVSVTFAVGLGGGGVTGGSATTNASGIATVGSWTLGTAAGTDNNTLTATSGSLSGSPVTFTASASAGTPATLAISAGDGQSATVNTNVGVAPAVLVTDAFGNPVPSASVTFVVTLGGGSVSGSPASTNASGIATVTSWKLGTTAGANTLHATLAALTPVDFSATGTADAATTIAINGGNAQSATVNTAVAVAPSAIVTDQFGNPVSGISVTFAASGDGSVNPNTAIFTNGSGIVQVTTWTLATTAGANTLTATSSPALTGSPLSFSATGTAGTATQMSLNAGNGQSATVNTAVAVDPSVLVQDVFGNPVQGVTITFTVAPGNGFTSPASPASVPTDASGIAAITNWFLGTAAGTDSLTATASLSGSPITFTATATPGAVSAAQSTVVDGATNITACNAACTVLGGTADSITVTVRDGFANPITGASVVISSTGTNNTFAPSASGSTNSSGVFAAKLSSSTAQAKSISATANTVTITQTAAVTVDPGAVSLTNSLLSAGTATITACSVSCVAGSTASTITATIRDQFSNVIPAKIVTFSSTGTGNTFTASAIDTTNASGVASRTFNSTVAQAKTISAAVTGSGTLTPTAGVTVNAAAPSSVIVSNQGLSARVGTGVATRPTYTVRDAFSNLVTGFAITITSSGGGTPSPTSGSTNGSGQFTLTSWTMGGTAADDASGRMANTATLTAGSASGVATDYGIYTWAGDVNSLLGSTSPCEGCHSLRRNPNNIVGVASSCGGIIYVVAGNATSSFVYQKISQAVPACGSQMPAGGPFYGAANLKIVRAWINNGALDN